MQPERDADVLVVLAHQDDEVGVLTRIRWEQAHGARVWCAYATDGAKTTPAAVRDAESRAVLASAGVPPERIGLLGEDRRIADGALAAHAPAALAALRGWGERILALRCIYTLDWEGGHHDHDTVHAIALAYARERAVPVFAFSLYNGFARAPGWYRVTSFVPRAGAGIVRRALSLRDALAPLRAVTRYPSQWRSWMGLAGGLAVRAIARREERMRGAHVAALAERPHAGVLLYEARFGGRYEDVRAAVDALHGAELAQASP